jgi:hypothetical protein
MHIRLGALRVSFLLTSRLKLKQMQVAGARHTHTSYVIHSDVPKIMKIRMQNTAGHTAGAHVYVAFLTSPHGGSEHDRVVRQLIDRAPRVEEPMFTLQPVMVLMRVRAKILLPNALYYTRCAWRRRSNWAALQVRAHEVCFRRRRTGCPHGCARSRCGRSALRMHEMPFTGWRAA